jgi:hypothetical protein
MNALLKTVVTLMGLILGLSGCADMNAMLGAQPQPTVRYRPIEIVPPVPLKAVQIKVPDDSTVAAAMDDALPNIEKVIGIHRCIPDWKSLRMLNVYAVPGEDMMSATDNRWSYPNSPFLLEYHDKNKCLGVSILDRWTMPALNALQFRVVYLADDSGETLNYQFLFKKMDDGSWKIDTFDKK